MQEIFIRDYKNGNFAYFMNREDYIRKIEEEMKNIEFDIDVKPSEYIDYDLVEIIEFNGPECDSIGDMINELYKYDTSDLLLDEYKYKVKKEDIRDGCLLYPIKGSMGDMFSLSFNLVSMDNDDLLDSKVSDVRINVV